jgi:hypothetical protein
MLRLTLRSGKDGRFLCRIIDSGGFPFVLDMGDRRIIDDAQQRILHGFTMWRYGQLLNAHPQDADFMRYLADYYSHEGLLVFFEEPNWEGRGKAPEPDSAEAPPVPAAFALSDHVPVVPHKPSLSLEEEEDPLEDAPTESAEIDGLTDLGPLLERLDE